MTRPNGVATNYQYDILSRLLSVLHQAGTSTIDGEAYTLDAAGNRTAKTDYLAGVTSNYTYDKIYELMQVTQGTNTTENYSYDPVGNRLSALGVASYTYNPSNELTITSTGTYGYDANGNETSKTDSTGTTTYTWDFENHLKQVTLPNSGGTVTFFYDPFGRRIQKAYTTGSNPPTTTTTNYLYDGDNEIEQVDQNGSIVSRVAQGQSIDEPLALSVSGATDFYEQDGLGSVTSLSSSAGALANTYTYDSFGKLTNSSGTITNPFQYTGRELDAETGLYYFRARYLDPTTGRFLSEDPMEFAGGDVNLYRYVYNNAGNYVDATGFFPTGKDKWWGHKDPNFRWWWHNCYWKGEPYDGTKEDVETAWGLWNGLGRPPKGDCGGKKKPCQPEPAPEPEPEPSPDTGPNWKVVGLGVGVVAVGIGVAILCPECLVLAPAFAP